LAAVSSGRSDFWISAFSKLERPTGAGAATASMDADPLLPTAGKAVVRTVITFFLSLDCTVWMALPA
jgi:hypothetical protein